MKVKLRKVGRREGEKDMIWCKGEEEERKEDRILKLWRKLKEGKEKGVVEV